MPWTTSAEDVAGQPGHKGNGRCSILPPVNGRSPDATEFSTCLGMANAGKAALHDVPPPEQCGQRCGEVPMVSHCYRRRSCRVSPNTGRRPDDRCARTPVPEKKSMSVTGTVPSFAVVAVSLQLVSRLLCACRGKLLGRPGGALPPFVPLDSRLYQAGHG